MLLFGAYLGFGSLIAVGSAHNLPIISDYPGKRIVRKFSLLQWSFFGSTPIMRDYYCSYRVSSTRTEDETVWHLIVPIPTRAFRKIFWDPDSRLQKVVQDLAFQALEDNTKLSLSASTFLRSPALELLDGMVRRKIRQENADGSVLGYQFAIVADYGYDDTKEPELLLASPYRKWTK